MSKSDSQIDVQLRMEPIGPTGPLSHPGPGPLPMLDLNSTGPLPPLGDGTMPGASGSELASTGWQAASGTPSTGWQAGGGAGLPAASTERITVGSGSVWLDGDVLMCACPECRAPMTIRIWLMVADCWRCGISIELTEEQEREVERLLQMRQQQQPKRPSPAASPAAATPKTVAPGPKPEATREKSADKTKGDGQPRPTQQPQQTAARRRRRASNVPVGVRADLEKLSHVGMARVWLTRFIKDLPAWLVSTVFHLVLLIILGLLTLREERVDPFITISTTFDQNVRAGEPEDLPDPLKNVRFDLPMPDKKHYETPEQQRALIVANQQAKQLRLDPFAPDPQLPRLDDVRKMIQSGDPDQRALAVRDPRLRVEMIKREGGTTLTEAAVSRALRWMAQHQNADGSWSLNDFHRAPNAPGNSGGQGQIRSDSAATSLVLLPYLGAGQTHLSGIYKDHVAQGLRWLIENQGEDGDLRIDSQGNSGMYAHGQGAIVLCEAFALTQDEQLRIAAQKAIDFIVEAQHQRGGWRYRPGEEGDTSVLGWQLMALQSAHAAGLKVPSETMELAGHYLDSVQQVSDRNAVLYSYQRGREPTHVMTAEALLCRMYLGWTKEQPGVMGAVRYLVDDHLPEAHGENASIYYWYYATQVMHHVGGPEWERWNEQIRDLLVELQEREGPEAGSWPPIGPHARVGGRLYVTSLAACTLEVYYRHAPIFRRIKLE